MSDAFDDRGLPANYPLQEQWEVTPADVKQGLAADEIALVDIREPAESRAAKIEQATLIPMGEIPQRIGDLEALADEKPLVLHCHHGQRSLQAVLWLAEQGIEAKSMAGGIDVWSRAIDPSVPRY